MPNLHQPDEHRSVDPPVAAVAERGGEQSASVRLWWQRGQTPPRPWPLTGPVALDQPDQPLQPPEATWHVTGPLVQPIRPTGPALAALLLTDRWHHAAALNGQPLAAGIHLLQHADHLEFDGHDFWISQHTEAVACPYDPAVHGEDMFCFLSKARLQPGQMCVACPGLPGVACNVLYQLDSWQVLAAAESALRCANCGYRPDASCWQPPATGQRSHPHDLASLLHSLS